MSKFLSFLILIALSVSSAAIAVNKEGGNMSTDEKNVLSTVERMTAAFHNGDIEGVMASYEDKVAVVFEPEKPVSDPAVLREMFQGWFTFNPQFNYTHGHEVFVANDIAVHIAPWTMTGKTPEGEDIEQSGLSVAVLRRQPDGKWLMVIDNPHSQYLMRK